MEQSTGTTASPNRMVVILVGVIVVLLLAIVAYFVFTSSSTDTATSDATTTDATTATSSMTATEVEFDPATATVVAAGLTPEAHVSGYFDAVVAGDYTTAYAMLPTAKQDEYGDEAAFTEQLMGYGITSYTIDGVEEVDGETQVTATAVMSGGSFQYLWTFVKDGENWLVKSRTLPGMN